MIDIAWAQFTPWTSLAGGLLIGLAAAILLLGAGRIAGIAGIVGAAWQLLRQGKVAHEGARWAFIAGLLIAPWVWQLAAPLPPLGQSLPASPALLIGAGLLVGIGVRLGSGCTSGHGVCGLSRGSPRSLVNVLAFMGAGFVTVAAMRAVLG
jgi:uncharacterized membrane protein YedE/YeeE